MIKCNKGPCNCRMLKTSGVLLLIIVLSARLQAQTGIFNTNYVSFTAKEGTVPLVTKKKSIPILAEQNMLPSVANAIEFFREDIERVTGIKPALLNGRLPGNESCVVIVGTVGNKGWIDKLIKERKIDDSDVRNKWETSLIQVVDNPFKGLKKALVIAGSDKRGTIFGLMDISARIGVSPWYWWADVPVVRHPEIYINEGRYNLGEPKVKYRGFFINDEAPALSGWAKEKFGGFNHLFYEKVYELLLRMKGNYLWPAMWGSAFNDDDSLNTKTADRFGIVMGTSHHEPMVRAHDEWRRYGSGPWNYEKNEEKLKEFWTQGIKRMGTSENIVSVGMRGDGDMPMSQESNIALLERIIKDQRTIIQKVTGKEPGQVPQMWALYKEVQDYYDKGMRVPDDVTLLLCDDNWGNIRKLPSLTDKPRAGGYGIYYHFDYVGGPRNYKWLNTNPIARVWEQMHLAYEHGVRQVWIVNVGDIKPMEFPLQFFLDYAWNPDRIQANQLPVYTRCWAEQQFGQEFAGSVSQIITKYLMYNGRRKPELLNLETYSLTNYLEAETVVKDYNKLLKEAEAINNQLPVEFKDAYYQLVLHPVQACANLNELYFTVGKNHWYAKQGRTSANDWAIKARELYTRDSMISLYYNQTLAGGKWNHMMDQTHIGYTYWQQPPKNRMPEVDEAIIPLKAGLGVAVEGSAFSWPNDSLIAVLPEFSSVSKENRYFELFNRGKTPLNFTIASPSPALSFSSASGTLEKDLRVWVNVDWQQINTVKARLPITIEASTGQKVTLFADVFKPEINGTKGYMETDGYISMEAAHYSAKIETDSIHWLTIPDFGRTLSGITPVPVTSGSQKPENNCPRLEYTINSNDTGTVKVYAYFSPTLHYNNAGLHYGISLDNEVPQVINVHSDTSQKTWETWVSNNIAVKVSSHLISRPGQHVLTFWMVDPGLVLQKIVIDFGGLRQSYLGPPESFRIE